MRILTERWVFTLALTDPGDTAPYPTPLFYALIEPNAVGRHAGPLMVFASEASSHHGRLCGAGPCPAAGAVYLESETIGELRGAQLRGAVVRQDLLSEAAIAELRRRYLARHPVAEPVLAGGRHHLYALIVRWAKLTDARLGLSKSPRSPAAAGPSREGLGAHPIADFDGSWSEVEQSLA